MKPLDEDSICQRCHQTVHVEFDDEPTEYCHNCAQELVIELKARLSTARAVLTDCLSTVHELTCYDSDFYNRTPARLEAIQDALKGMEGEK